MATGNCVKATLANCDKVSSRDSTKCDECALGFARDLAGQCTVKVSRRRHTPAPPPASHNCALPGQQSPICPGHAPCPPLQCIDGCARCRVGSPTVCNACLSGFGRNATATACLPW